MVEVQGRYIEDYHRLREKERMSVKFMNRKDSLHILRKKIHLNLLLLHSIKMTEQKLLSIKICVPKAEVSGRNEKTLGAKKNYTSFSKLVI